MSELFFKSDCKEQSIEYPLFGICDDEDGKKAYTDIKNKSNWIATVHNINKLKV